MPDYRLGDVIDDFCVRCKRIMNHNLVSLVNGEPAKVRCRTCHSDHDYRHEQPPPPKIDPKKQALFDEVLKKVSPDGSGGPVPAPEPEAADPEILEAEASKPPAPKPPAKGKSKKTST